MTDKLTKLGTIIADYKNLSTTDLNDISDLFNLTNSNSKVITQLPGEVQLLSTDDLKNLNPEFTTSIIHIVIHLEDWQIGQFSSYDDYIHTHWKAGEIMTYDWYNVQYCSANAGTSARNTLQITGICTPQTKEFLNRIKRFGTHQLRLTDNSWH